jgi:hypothetical protein
MAKIGSASFAVLLADGYDLLAAKLKGFTHKEESLTVQTDGLGDGNEEHTPVNMTRASLTQSGAFFESATNGMHLALRASSGVARILSYAYGGNTLAAPFTGALGAFKTAYEVLVQMGGLTQANAMYIVDGAVDEGTIQQVQGALTTTGNGASVDYTTDPSQRVIAIVSATKANPCVVTTTGPHGLTTGQKVLISGNSLAGPAINSDLAVTVISTTTFSVAVNTSASSGAGTDGSFVLSSTVGGAAGYQQVPAYSGFTGVIGKIQHAPDDSTWADLITFVNVTSAPGAQRVTAAGTVDRYTRYVRTVTGAGSITPFVGLSRS